MDWVCDCGATYAAGEAVNGEQMMVDIEVLRARHAELGHHEVLTRDDTPPVEPKPRRRRR